MSEEKFAGKFASEVPQPDDTEWVIVKHTRFPVVQDTVVGHYPTANDATLAFNQIMSNPQWFTTYSIEHRNK